MTQGHLRAKRRWTAEDIAQVQARQPAAAAARVEAIRPPWNHAVFEAFEFRLPWAPSVNSAYANTKNGRVKSTTARRYGELVMLALFEQRVPTPCIAHPCRLWILQHATSDRGDPDNGLKVVIDSLKRYGVLADDNRKIVKRVTVIDGSRSTTGFIEVRIEPELEAPPISFQSLRLT